MSRFALLGLCLLMVFSGVLWAQSEDEKAREKQRRINDLVAQVLAEVPSLKLGENRAIVYAKAGNVIWKNDETKAREMFQAAVSELINAQEVAEADKRHPSELLTGGSTRPQILNLIASHDAEWAIDLMVKTRPAQIQKALAASGENKNGKISGYGGSNYLAVNEANMERNLVRMAADQSPARAAKLLKESLDKGLSSESVGMIRRLAEKDPSLAAEIASRSVDKMLNAKLSVDGQPDSQTIQTVVSFLNDFISSQAQPDQQQLRYDSGQMNRLAQKLIAFSLVDGGRNAPFIGSSIVTIAEKLSPSAAEALRRSLQNTWRGEFSSQYSPEVQKLMSSDASAEELIAAAVKLPAPARTQLLQRAANKYAQDGNVEAARRVLEGNFAGDALDQALQSLKSQQTYHLMNSGRFEEAERLINEMPENTQISSLLNLAVNVYQHDRNNNKSYAAALITRALGMIGDPPENSTDTSNLVQVINTYLGIDEPDGAFSVEEKLIGTYNNLSEAMAVVGQFQGSNVKNGELLLGQGGMPGSFGLETYYFKRFADSDYDRTQKLLDSLSRREARLFAKLQLAESL